MDDAIVNDRPSTLFYCKILEFASTNLMLIDLNSNLVVYANKTCEAAYGYLSEEFIGMTIDQFSMTDNNKIQREIQKVIKKAPEAHRILAIHRHKTGRQFPVEIMIKLVVINGRRYLLYQSTDITRHTKLQGRISNLIKYLSNHAYRDYLTGVYNRAYLYNVYLSRVIGCKIGVLVLDIDRFKLINERYGHEGGDIVLQSVAKLIGASLRPKDKIFRYGGDEFVAILRDIDTAEIDQVAQKMSELIAKTSILCNNGKVCCTVSIGKAKGYIVENNDLEDLIRAADSELMKIKSLRPKL